MDLAYDRLRLHAYVDGELTSDEIAEFEQFLSRHPEAMAEVAAIRAQNNAMHARYNQVEIAHSRLRETICRVLLAEGFLAGIETSGEGYKKKLMLALRYSSTREPVIRGLQRVSRPSLRRYAGAATMPRVTGGMGLQVVSTPLGA